MRRLVAVAVTAGAVFLCALGASAGERRTLLVDRGLPAGYLNNVAGADRSNVAWADWEPSLNPATRYPAEYWLPGDDFTIPGPGQYKIRTIRVWIVGNDAPDCDGRNDGEHRRDQRDGLMLWGGTYTSGIGPVSIRCSVTSVTYADGATYQGNSGAMIRISQVDFTVDVDLRGGETFTFFVDGPWALYNPNNTAGGWVNAFLHASNRLKSVAAQAGANDWLLFLHRKNRVTVGVETWNSETGAGTQCGPVPCPGWDKPSDANVQVFGEARKY
jgi:hypothetical protein